ncbi:hypothetical protein OAM69_03475 [bacterium]|nr:hypothetical protein [bacterium]
MASAKKLQTTRTCVAQYYVFHNFIQIHKSLKVTPAMESGLAHEVRDFEWIVGLIDLNAPKPGPRGKYKKKNPAA